jgi:hypothetical protein
MGDFGEPGKASTPSRIDEVDDVADTSAVGGRLTDLPPGYYRSPQFVGSIIGVILMANSLYLGFVLPANTLTVINADIGLLYPIVPEPRQI